MTTLCTRAFDHQGGTTVPWIIGASIASCNHRQSCHIFLVPPGRVLAAGAAGRQLFAHTCDGPPV